MMIGFLPMISDSRPHCMTQRNSMKKKHDSCGLKIEGGWLAHTSQRRQRYRASYNDPHVVADLLRISLGYGKRLDKLERD